MKKAVIQTGAKQYVVSEGDVLRVELLKSEGKSVDFVPLLVIDGEDVKVGTPEVSGAKVTAKIIEESSMDDKVLSIRYKSKKRVNKKRGHRQKKTIIEISKIA